jgi:hypothetical protein
MSTELASGDSKEMSGSQTFRPLAHIRSSDETLGVRSVVAGATGVVDVPSSDTPPLTSMNASRKHFDAPASPSMDMADMPKTPFERTFEGQEAKHPLYCMPSKSFKYMALRVPWPPTDVLTMTNEYIRTNADIVKALVKPADVQLVLAHWEESNEKLWTSIAEHVNKTPLTVADMQYGFVPTFSQPPYSKDKDEAYWVIQIGSPKIQALARTLQRLFFSNGKGVPPPLHIKLAIVRRRLPRYDTLA